MIFFDFPFGWNRQILVWINSATLKKSKCGNFRKVVNTENIARHLFREDKWSDMQKLALSSLVSHVTFTKHSRKKERMRGGMQAMSKRKKRLEYKMYQNSSNNLHLNLASKYCWQRKEIKYVYYAISTKKQLEEVIEFVRVDFFVVAGWSWWIIDCCSIVIDPGNLENCHQWGYSYHKITLYRS